IYLHADFRAGVQIDPAVHFAGDGAADDVDHAEGECALLLRFTESRERVGGFTRLRNRDENRVLFDDRIAIAELAGVSAFGHNLRQVFEEIIADKPGMPGGSLAGEDEPL